jgi:trigger factor
MKSTLQKLPKSMLEITIEVSADELIPFLKKSAEKISETAKIEGFRPGKAPYEIVVKKYGEQAILQEAIDDIIMKTYYDAVKEHDILPIGQPKIDLERLTPDSPFIYKATITVLPAVKVGDLTKIKITKDKIEVKEEKVDQVIEEIRSMRAKEEVRERPAQTGDLVKFDFSVYRDGVPIENGVSKNYPLVIGENRFIPGFEENLIGLSAGEEKEFKLKFPEEYHEKTLAGKPAEFKVTVNEVLEIIKPEMTDDLAKEISNNKFATVIELKENISKNLLEEETAKADRMLEVKILEEAVKLCEFEELPEMLVHEEIHRMLHELEDSISKQGMQLTDYLEAIKKTHDELEKDMEPQAEMRVKTSVLSRTLYQEQKMEVTPDEVEKEIEEVIKHYPNNPDVRKQIDNETYKDYLKNVIGNRKVMDYLKSIAVK